VTAVVRAAVRFRRSHLDGTGIDDAVLRRVKHDVAGVERAEPRLRVPNRREEGGREPRRSGRSLRGRLQVADRLGPEIRFVQPPRRGKSLERREDRAVDDAGRLDAPPRTEEHVPQVASLGKMFGDEAAGAVAHRDVDVALGEVRVERVDVLAVEVPAVRRQGDRVDAVARVEQPSQEPRDVLVSRFVAPAEDDEEVPAVVAAARDPQPRGLAEPGRKRNVHTERQEGNPKILARGIGRCARGTNVETDARRTQNMVTFLAGGTGTPKLLDGADRVFDPAAATVVANTGDDVELGGLLVCPDVDTVLFHGGGVLDTETWWGIDGDTTATYEELHRLADAASLDSGPRYLDDDAQTAGREIARWRRFSGVAEFMQIGDRDRAVHLTRTSLLDEGCSLTDVTRTLADAFDLEIDLLPMSDDPVATMIHTPGGPIHFQEYWVHRRADPEVRDVEFRGAATAEPTPAVRDALDDPVIVGPSNPITSLGPMLAMDAVADALASTPVVAVSPFVGSEVFSGPAAELMAGVGREPSTSGVADAYPFADAFVLDEADETQLDRPVVRTDTRMDDSDDAERVARAAKRALAEVA